jgi:long-subunit acyl-CoA synthetase (AMP-forming)
MAGLRRPPGLLHWSSERPSARTSSMPIPSKNLGRCYDASLTPDKVAVIDTKDPGHPLELTYRAFDAECDAVARGLKRMGLARGDRVGILSLNRFELLAAFFGVMRAGLVAVADLVQARARDRRIHRPGRES